MADSFTDNYGFTQPEVGGSLETWGGKLNANWGQLDTLLKAKLDEMQAQLTDTIESRIAPLKGWVDSSIGRVAWWTSDEFPPNCLPVVGQLLSRATYPKLFAVVGTRYALEGDPSDQFRLPAMQDRYVRAIGGASGEDLGETLEDALRSHGHAHTMQEAGAHLHTGRTQEAGQHDHSGSTSSYSHAHQFQTYQGTGGDNQRVAGTIASTTPKTVTTAQDTHSHTFTTSQAPAHAHDFTTSQQPAHVHSLTISETGGDETRPRTIRLIPVIYCDWEV